MATAAEREKSSNKETTEKLLLQVYQGDYGEIPTIGRNIGQERMTLSRNASQRRGFMDAILFESDLVSTPHCELLYENGKQWVKDLHSQYGTFLNGSKLFPGLTFEIQPGDSITLGWSPINVSSTMLKTSMKIKKGPHDRRITAAGQVSKYYETEYFVFKLKVGFISHLEPYRPWDDGHVQQSNSAQSGVSTELIAYSPLLPEEVVFKICKKFDVEDLKNCRLVSKTWNSAIVPIFISKSQVSLECYFEAKDSAKKNVQFVEDMKNLQNTNFAIYFKSSPEKLIRPYNDNLWFFTEYLKLQNLTLNCDIMASWGFVFLEKLLANSCSSLQKLDFFVRKSDAVPSPLFLFQDIVSTKFPKLKKLSLKMNYEPESEFFNNMVQTLPNLEELIIEDKRILKSIFDVNGTDASVNFPRSLALLDITDVVPAPSIREFNNIVYPLKKLRMEITFRFGVVDPGLSSALYALLLKLQNSLEELELGVAAEVIVNLPDIKFPKLPILKSLCICVHDDFGIGFATDSGNTGIINYATHFPSLQKLVLRCDTSPFSPYVKCFKSFFPDSYPVNPFSACIIESVQFSFPMWRNPCRTWLMDGNEPPYIRVRRFFPYLINVVETEYSVKCVKV